MTKTSLEGGGEAPARPTPPIFRAVWNFTDEWPERLFRDSVHIIYKLYKYIYDECNKYTITFMLYNHNRLYNITKKVLHNTISFS